MPMSPHDHVKGQRYEFPTKHELLGSIQIHPRPNLHYHSNTLAPIYLAKY